ncbi:transglycosylase domain-containing protein [Sunxiuqinia dokdonensis]|uniref:Penicillin-binding protein 1A n=1 Tax=Sunxiuqinia dokdonensis TaxID=1409788 RepID=A0A0L8VBQ5_9BACT|nr:transglycosylase domain-containing protein [Sunxiuqinia dokdonensis]KOH45607.1 penicillin-binding protein 1A [Sunxiuqinia dokdonensis]
MEKEKNKFRKYTTLFWSFYFVGLLAVVAFFFFIAKGKLGEMPTFRELENPQSLLASDVISRDHVVLGRYFRENRSYVDYENLTPELIQALVATEDVRFYRHSGIDLQGLLRVAKGVITGDESSGGGSTISQQLAKMLFPRQDFENKLQLVFRKFKEWVIAVKLERSYTKEEIMTMYLNKYDFLNLAVGIKSASRIYFNVEPDSLQLHQAAMFVGMAKNSSLYNPVRRPELTKQRRNVVLSQMKKYGYINQQTYDSVKALPLGLDYQKEDFKRGLAPYFREYLRITMGASKPDRSRYASWQQVKFEEDSVEWETNPLFGWCKKNFKPDGTNYDLYEDGLKIYTTIDSRMQKYAEEALEDHLKLDLQPAFDKHLKRLNNPPFSGDMSNSEVDDLLNRFIRQSERYRVLRLEGKNFDQIKQIFKQPVEMEVFTWQGDQDTIMSPLDSIRHYLSFFRSSFMSMDLATGQVRAYVGGPNYKHFMYDMVKGGKRQVGSTVKPFLYTLAMQNGLSPCTKVPNVRQQFVMPDGTIWEAKNSSREREGEMVTLKWGLANSVNQISAWVMKQFNPKSVVNVMNKMGVYSWIDPVPSMFLGTSDITLYEMVGAYGTFANKGVYTQPIFVTHIEDKHGNVIARFRPERHDAIDEQTAYLMVNLLQGVVDSGSGRRVRWHPVYGQIEGPIAGKTGTTQNHSDGWFMGITPQLVGGVWTGADLRSIHFDDISTGQGANMALPIWGRFMKKVYADETLEYGPDHEFERPMNFIMNLDCDEENNPQQKPTEFEDFF